MKIGAIIQARMASCRLPGKILLPLPHGGSATVLDQVILRVSKSKRVDEIVVATTDNPSDEPLVRFCEGRGIQVFRGSESNVLSRFVFCAQKFGMDHIVRLTGDNPCVDWQLIDELVETHLNEKNDYSSIVLSSSFPHGISAEVITHTALADANERATQPYEIEHVTPFIYKTCPGDFRIGVIQADPARTGPHIRVTLDTPEDYLLLRAVFDLLGDPLTFLTADIVRLFTEKPWLLEINGRVQQKTVCRNLEEELAEALRLLKAQDLNLAAEYLRDHVRQEYCAQEPME